MTTAKSYVHFVDLEALENFDETSQDFNFISKSDSSKTNIKTVVPRLTPEEAKKVFEYQHAMLIYMQMQYKNSIGTPKEAEMRKMYDDSIKDYNAFQDEYEKELKAIKEGK